MPIIFLTLISLRPIPPPPPFFGHNDLFLGGVFALCIFVACHFWWHVHYMKGQPFYFYLQSLNLTRKSIILIAYVLPFIKHVVTKQTLGKLIYTCKIIQPGIFSRLSQPVHFSRFKPDNLLLSKHCKIFRLQPGKIYRLTKPGKTARLDHFTGID